MQKSNFTSDIEATPGNLKILLVEDNILAQKVAELILRDLDCQVQIADCGKKALKLFSKNKYDLAFIDIGLPDMSGYLVIEEIRKIEKEQAYVIPVVILTAHAAHDVEKNCLNLKNQEIITKPLSKEKATAVIKRYVIKNDLQLTHSPE